MYPLQWTEFRQNWQFSPTFPASCDSSVSPIPRNSILWKSMNCSGKWGRQESSILQWKNVVWMNPNILFLQHFFFPFAIWLLGANMVSIRLNRCKANMTTVLWFSEYWDHRTVLATAFFFNHCKKRPNLHDKCKD